MVTIKDIAKALEISPSTVTRALAGHPRISQETIRRVRAKADELGYIANRAASQMRGGNSGLVGLLVPDILNGFYAAMAQGVSDACSRHGYQVLLALTDDDPEIEERQVREMVASRCAGILLVPSPGLSDSSTRLLMQGQAAQLVRRNSALACDWHGLDDRAAIAAAVDYLADLGHQRIAYIGGSGELSTGQERFQGFTAALQQRDLECPGELVFRGEPSGKFGEQAMAQLMAMGNPPTAVISAGVALTEGMLEYLASDTGHWRPSLVGYGESSAFRWWGKRSLTTIELPVRELANELCEQLIGRIEGRITDVNPRQKRHPARLLLRGSAGRP